jgi:hypothetical protein
MKENAVICKEVTQDAYVAEVKLKKKDKIEKRMKQTNL